MAVNNITIDTDLQKSMAKVTMVGIKNGIKANTTQTNVELVYAIFERVNKLNEELFEKVTGYKK